FAGQRARFLGRVLKRTDSLHAPLVVAKAGWRGGHATRGPLEELDLERALNCCHVLGNAGLSGILPLRSAGEGSFFTDRDYGADLPQRDIGHKRPINWTIRKSNDRTQNILFLL